VAATSEVSGIRWEGESQAASAATGRRAAREASGILSEEGEPQASERGDVAGAAAPKDVGSARLVGDSQQPAAEAGAGAVEDADG